MFEINKCMNGMMVSMQLNFMSRSSKMKNCMGHSSKKFLWVATLFSIPRKCAPPPVQVNCDRSLMLFFPSHLPFGSQVWGQSCLILTLLESR